MAVFIVAAKRTAFGAFGGKFKDLSATVLGQKAASAALESSNVDPSHVKSVIFGNVIQVSFIIKSRVQNNKEKSRLWRYM